jgi:hypothetical protein
MIPLLYSRHVGIRSPETRLYFNSWNTFVRAENNHHSPCVVFPFCFFAQLV